jgi:formylglycine-generating enzyme required for sulfatase activity
LTQYRDDDDPGVHAAAEWVLRGWDKSNKAAVLPAQPKADALPKKRWYVNGQGQAFGILGPAAFDMGEGKQEHPVTIKKTVAIGAREVTVREFKQFRPGHPHEYDTGPTLSCPVNNVSWYAAAAYCNWLSEKEGIDASQWCYVQAAEGDEGLRPADDCYQRTGYRLPSETEWEFACRAGASTRWSYGDGMDELLAQYARCSLNSHVKYVPQCSAVGTLKPNDFGLFDMHGNVAEWCQDAKNGLRAMRGGSFQHLPINIQSTSASAGNPSRFGSVTGFRVARTLPRPQ